MADAWKAKIRRDLEHYKDFPGEPWKSIPYFDQMIDRGFFTINSQEGVVSRDPRLCSRVIDNDIHHDKKLPVMYTERAYVTGYMPIMIAKRFSYFLNLTDKVAIVDVMGSIPVSYGMCFEVDDKELCPRKSPFPATHMTAECHHGDLNKEMNSLGKVLRQKMAFVQCFDPKHGRTARKHLYKDVIECMDLAIKSLT